MLFCGHDIKSVVGPCHECLTYGYTNEIKRSCEVACPKPSMGITLFLSIIGFFGVDRFYCGQTNVGVALIVASITVVGLVLVIPYQIVSQLLLVMSILQDCNTSPMYGCITFEHPNVVDKLLAMLYILVFIVLVVIGIYELMLNL